MDHTSDYTGDYASDIETGLTTADSTADAARESSRESVRESSRESVRESSRERVPASVPENAPHRNGTEKKPADSAGPPEVPEAPEATEAVEAAESAVETAPETENVPHARVREQREPADGGPAGDDDPATGDDAWDDGLIARRVTETGKAAVPVLETRGPGAPPPAPLAYDGALRSRLDALRELVGLSRTRLDSNTLSEAGRVLDEAAARRRLSGQHTVVALAGGTGRGQEPLIKARPADARAGSRGARA
ncbi:ATP-binding protein, partial [Streptomyces sp. NPDC059627]